MCLSTNTHHYLPYPVVVYTAGPSHLYASYLRSIIENNQTFDFIVTFPCEIIFPVQHRCKGQRNQCPINQSYTILTMPCALLILALILFHSSSSGHQITFFCSFRKALHACITHSFTAPLEIPIAQLILCRDASLP
jgi:hypothetical protein